MAGPSVSSTRRCAAIDRKHLGSHQTSWTIGCTSVGSLRTSPTSRCSTGRGRSEHLHEAPGRSGRATGQQRQRRAHDAKLRQHRADPRQAPAPPDAAAAAPSSSATPSADRPAPARQRDPDASPYARTTKLPKECPTRIIVRRRRRDPGHRPARRRCDRRFWATRRRHSRRIPHGRRTRTPG